MQDRHPVSMIKKSIKLENNYHTITQESDELEKKQVPKIKKSIQKDQQVVQKQQQPIKQEKDFGKNITQNLNHPNQEEQNFQITQSSKNKECSKIQQSKLNQRSKIQLFQSSDKFDFKNEINEQQQELMEEEVKDEQYLKQDIFKVSSRKYNITDSNSKNMHREQEQMQEDYLDELYPIQDQLKISDRKYNVVYKDSSQIDTMNKGKDTLIVKQNSKDSLNKDSKIMMNKCPIYKSVIKDNNQKQENLKNQNYLDKIYFEYDDKIYLEKDSYDEQFEQLGSKNQEFSDNYLNIISANDDNQLNHTQSQLLNDKLNKQNIQSNQILYVDIKEQEDRQINIVQEQKELSNFKRFIRLQQDFTINKHKKSFIDYKISKKQQYNNQTEQIVKDYEVEKQIKDLNDEISYMQSMNIISFSGDSSLSKPKQSEKHKQDKSNNEKILSPDKTNQFENTSQSDKQIKQEKMKNAESEENQQIAISEKAKKQGTYKMTTPQHKELFLLKCVQGEIPEDAAEKCGLAIKCAKRWIQNLSAERLKGGGRKIVDPILEQKLRLWLCLKLYVNWKVPSREEQIRYSMENSMDQRFKASKGWLEKYLDRNYLKLVLQEQRRNTPIQLVDIAKFFIIVPDNYAKTHKQQQNSDILRDKYFDSSQEYQQNDKQIFSQLNNDQFKQNELIKQNIKIKQQTNSKHLRSPEEYCFQNTQLKENQFNSDKIYQNENVQKNINLCNSKESTIMYSHMKYKEQDNSCFINLIQRANIYRRSQLLKEKECNPRIENSQKYKDLNLFDNKFKQNMILEDLNNENTLQINQNPQNIYKSQTNNDTLKGEIKDHLNFNNERNPRYEETKINMDEESTSIEYENSNGYKKKNNKSISKESEDQQSKQKKGESLSEDLKFYIDTKRPLPAMIRQILKHNIMEEREQRIGIQTKSLKPENLDIIFEIERTFFFEVAINQLKLDQQELLQSFKCQ